jgi:pantoate--beta-alanine ligase
VLELTDPGKLRQTCDDVRRAGRRVGLVPTMGYLHEGHLSLVRRARELADFVVVTIFVNPTQFGPNEDLARYPRDLAADRARCLAAGVACVFAPDNEAVYPPGYQTYVEVEGVSQGLCGARRPGHFRGVATVVTKLFNMVGPCVAVFGEKDYQQLLVIRRMAADLNLPVEIVGAPIVREPDGLAMSSRNAYLDPDQRRQATCLHRALQAVRERAAAAPLEADEALGIARAIIEAEPAARIDYVELRHAETLAPLPRVETRRTLLALAVFVGQTRLIDNAVF